MICNIHVSLIVDAKKSLKNTNNPKMITNASKYNNKRAKFDRAGGRLNVAIDPYTSSTRERIEIQMNEYGIETTRSREASLNVVSGLDKDAVFGLGCQLYSRHCL